MRIAYWNFWNLEFGILGIGYWVLSIEFWILDFGYWVLDFGIWNFGYRILKFGYWNLDIGILNFGYWNLEFLFQIYINQPQRSIKINGLILLINFRNEIIVDRNKDFLAIKVYFKKGLGAVVVNSFNGSYFAVV
ncbi:hypothetical protein BH23BAC2_BH23BAC2_21490 [soil metagenome]